MIQFKSKEEAQKIARYDAIMTAFAENNAGLAETSAEDIAAAIEKVVATNAALAATAAELEETKQMCNTAQLQNKAYATLVAQLQEQIAALTSGVPANAAVSIAPNTEPAASTPDAGAALLTKMREQGVLKTLRAEGLIV